MNKWLLVYSIIISLLLVGLFFFEEHRIASRDHLIAENAQTISSLKSSNAFLETQVGGLQECVQSNQTAFDKFRQCEMERLEVIEQIENVTIEKGSENKVGVISSENSDLIKDTLNKNFNNFNKAK